MKKSDFFYHLPADLIATHPPPQRSDSRLLIIQSEQAAIEKASDIYQQSQMSHFADWIESGDLLIFNDTRVLKARMFGHKPTGGQVEILVERILGSNEVLAHVRSNKRIKERETYQFKQGIQASVIKRKNNLFQLQFNCANIFEVLEAQGELPLPPYFNRAAENEDHQRYQSIFSNPEKTASVAAPTASLHFDQALIDRIKNKNINIAKVTLHIGAGTFQPVRTDNIHDHVMHSEWGDVPLETIQKIHTTWQNNKKVIAVGTTATRALESAFAQMGSLNSAWAGETSIFIYPGYQFKVVDRMLTNFHLPESTLIMLVSAAIGRENALAAYQYAIEHQFRFYSYGDAMLINTNKNQPS